jgi:predicted Zn finger-like uncharacterized protein
MSGAASTLGEAPEPVYTQCSKCQTVFKLSAEVLRAAGGQVRCGKCGELFNALARLAEESTAFPSDESPLELEARADSILESSVSLQVVRAVAKDEEVDVPPGVEGAQLEFVDPERALEFTLPPGELDRIFIESKKRVLPRPAPPLAPAPKAPAEGEAEVEVELDFELDEPAEPEPAEPEPAEPEPEEPEEPDPAERESIFGRPPAAVPDRRRPHGGGGGLEIPEDVRREMLAGIEDEIDPVSAVRNLGRSRVPRRAFYTWLGAAVAAALLLLAQILHHNRDWPIARAMSGLLSAPQSAPANLSAYQLRQWGVTGDPDANGTLKVRASILNSAAQLQPYPLLRVTLADRFGKKIGTRDFEPGEYLGKPTARLLAPGERVDATLQILDPGKNAEGFEIDVCLRGADQKISCAADVAPQR